MQLLHARRNPSVDRWGEAQTDRRSGSWRADLRHEPGWEIPALRTDRRARQVDIDQARLPRGARGRHRAGNERRPPFSVRSRLEARNQLAALRARPAASNNAKQPRRHRCVRATTGPDRRLSPRLPTRDDSRRRRLLVVVVHPLERNDRRDTILRPGSGRPRAALACAAIPPGLTNRHPRSVFAQAAGRRRQIWSIYTSRQSLTDRVRELVEWPLLPSLDWCRGFLAGVFDAEGSRSDFALRITNTDAQILAWIEVCAKHLGFAVAHDRTTNKNGLTWVRIRGGLVEHLRFFHLTDPAITRKRSIEGQIVRTFANLKVAAIEPLGKAMPLYDITTGTGDFIANGVRRVTTALLVRPTSTSTSTPGAISSARSSSRSTRRSVAGGAGAAVVEGGARRARDEHGPVSVGRGALQADVGIWEAMLEARNPSSVLTKSPLLLRDLGLMSELIPEDRVQRPRCRCRRSTSARGGRLSRIRRHPRARLEAVAELTTAPGSGPACSLLR